MYCSPSIDDVNIGSETDERCSEWYHTAGKKYDPTTPRRPEAGRHEKGGENKRQARQEQGSPGSLTSPKGFKHQGSGEQVSDSIRAADAWSCTSF
jgi:hypothetical protein